MSKSNNNIYKVILHVQTKKHERYSIKPDQNSYKGPQKFIKTQPQQLQ